MTNADAPNLPDSLKVIYSPHDLAGDFTSYMGVLISKIDEPDQIRYIVKKIRTNSNEKVSLLPIILHHHFKVLPPSLENFVDLMVVDLTTQSAQIADVVASIQLAMQRMAPIERADRYEDFVLTRALRFIYTRGKK